MIGSTANINHVLDLISQLDYNEKISVVDSILEMINRRDLNERNLKNELQEFLLKGPVLDDDQYQNFLDNRRKMSQWRNT